MRSSQPPELTPYKRGPNQSREDYKIYYDNFWASKGVKSPPATSFMMSNGRGVDVDEIGESYYSDSGEPLNLGNTTYQKLTPHTKSWPTPYLKCRTCGEEFISQRVLEEHHYEGCTAPRSFPLLGFVKYKWQSLGQANKEVYLVTGVMLWFISWAFSASLAEEFPLWFGVPWVVLSMIGGAVISMTVKHFVKGAWNRYFPEYQEFAQEYKSKTKNSSEEMDTIEDLFEMGEKPEGSYGTHRNDRQPSNTPYTKM